MIELTSCGNLVKFKSWHLEIPSVVNTDKVTMKQLLRRSENPKIHK